MYDFYDVKTQRNRYSINLNSRNGIQGGLTPVGAPNAVGCGDVVFQNLRKQGYLYDPTKYQGCIVGLKSFVTNMMSQAQYNLAYDNTHGVVANQHGRGACINICLKNVGDSNSISNLGIGAPPVATVGVVNQSNYSSNSQILKSVRADSTGGFPYQFTPAAPAPIVNDADTLQFQYFYQCESDPCSTGIYTSNPLDTIHLQLRDMEDNIFLGAGLSLDAAAGIEDLNYQINLVIQPLLRDCS